jgi:hypothetical protein
MPLGPPAGGVSHTLASLPFRSARLQGGVVQQSVGSGPEPGCQRSAIELAAVATAALAVLLILHGLVTARGEVLKDDSRHYAMVAEDPAYLPRLPYSFRVLTPLVVYLLPFETMAGFTVVTIAALWLTALFLYAFLRALGLSQWIGGVGMSLLLVSGATVRALSNPAYVDALSYLTEMAAFYFLLMGRDRLFTATVVIGVVNKETALLLIPVFLLKLLGEGRLGRSDLRRVASHVLLPLATLGAVVAFRLMAGGALENGLSPLEPMPRTFQQTIPSPQDLADIYSVFGIGWVLAAANLRRSPQVLRWGLLYAALILLQLSVARGDEGRVFSHLLPLVIPLAALEFRSLSRGPAVGLLVACLASMVHSRWVIVPGPYLRYGLVAAGSLAALVMLLSRRWTVRFRPTDGSPAEAAVPGRDQVGPSVASPGTRHHG